MLLCDIFFADQNSWVFGIDFKNLLPCEAWSESNGPKIWPLKFHQNLPTTYWYCVDKHVHVNRHVNILACFSLSIVKANQSLMFLHCHCSSLPFLIIFYCLYVCVYSVFTLEYLTKCLLNCQCTGLHWHKIMYLHRPAVCSRYPWFCQALSRTHPTTVVGGDRPLKLPFCRLGDPAKVVWLGNVVVRMVDLRSILMGLAHGYRIAGQRLWASCSHACAQRLWSYNRMVL